jgi:hypothetical protein
MFALVFGVTLTGMLFAPATPVSAYPGSVYAYQGGPTPGPGGGTTTPTPDGTPTPTPTPTPGATITENIFHIISFPFEAMTDAIVNMSNKIIGQAYKDAQWIYGDTLGLLIFGDYGIAPDAMGNGSSSTPLFARIIQPHWNVMFTLALLLLPATLALTAVDTLRSGVTSVMGYADLKEALLGWFIAAGAAAASFYLLGLAHRMSLSAAQAILLADFGERVSGQSLALAFFNTAAVAALAGLVPFAPIALLYVGFFVLFLASSIILGLAMALAAYTALVYMLSAIAPLVITLGVLRPMRWLHALWLKTITVVLLLPVADALLLKAAVSLVRSFYDPNGSGASLGSFLAGLFVTGGVLSVLIAINFKVGEMVFGALGEIHRHAWGATMGVVQLVATAIGLVAGGVGIAAGGAGLAGAGAAGAVAGGAGPAGGAEIASAIPAGASSAATAPGAAQGEGALASEAGVTAGGRVASTLETNPSLARRTADLLTSRLSGSSSLTQKSGHSDSAKPSSNVAGEQPDAGAEPEGGPAQAQSGAPESVPAGQSTSPMPGNAEPPESPPSGSVNPSYSPALSRAAPSAMPGASPQEMTRRSQLAEGFGRALAMTGNPALRGFGVGLQMAGAVGEFGARAGNLQDGRRATVRQDAESPRQENQLLESAMRWSGRNLTTAPNDIFDLGRDNTALMAGALHQAFLNDPDSGRATHMGDVLNVIRASYGQWQAQGQPGGVAAQRAYFEIIADPETAASPGRLTGAIVQWAEQYKVQLESGSADTIRITFDRSQSVSGGPTADQARRESA